MKNNLRAIRNMLKMTQAELAQMIGCSTGNISQIENNGQRIRQELAQRIVVAAKAKGRNITFEDIYGEMNMDKITIVEEVKPKIELLSDAFGGNHIVMNGRVFITINYISPWIDNAGMRSLSKKIMAILQNDNGPSCAVEQS